MVQCYFTKRVYTRQSHHNNSYKKIVFSYSIDCKIRKFYCHKVEEIIIVELNDNTDFWITIGLCRQHGYYNLFIFQYISEDFIELSNDEKLEVLEELSKR